ncbi:MAG: diguanylate cyclase [Demequinaceae bacterium]|nr:diguanylate cyclase [Demequinaceae bacterium]
MLAVQAMLVGFAALKASREAEVASRDTLAFVTDSVQSRVDNYVSPTRTTAHAAAYAIANENLEVETEMLPAILYRHLLRAPQLTGIHVIAPSGLSVEIWREGDGFVSRVAGRGFYPADVTRTHLATFAQETEQPTVGMGDPREDPLYAAAFNASVPLWTVSQIDPVNGLMIVSVAEVARSKAGEVTAIVWVDLGLEGLAEELAGVPVGDEGVSAVLDARGNVVAMSNGPVGAGADASSATVVGVTASDTGLERDAPLGAGEARRIVSATGSLLAEEARLQTPGGPDWTIHVQAKPRSLSAGISGLSTDLAWLALGSLLAVVGGVALGSWLTRPLHELTRRATKDALTGIPNRSEALIRGEAAARSARESGRVTCVLLCDLDNFKAINDTRGHSAGDEALVAVAEALDLEMRAGDVVGRWGGDEFMAVLTLPSSADARRVVDRIREGVEMELRRVVGVGLPVGVTMGYAESTEIGGGLQQMLDAADAALIEGKQIEKSRVYAAKRAETAGPGREDATPAKVVP